VCTVATRWTPGEPLRILALRDELVSRDFDEPGTWWPGQPGVVGGRDRHAGGSWCVTDVAAGVTALVLNRTERRHGTPSRGLLPLAAVAHGERWTDVVDHLGMASFTLVLATPTGVTTWEWDAEHLRRRDLSAGLHLMTPSGVDPDDARAARFGPKLATEPWPDVVTTAPPADDRSAIVVTHDVDGDTYATVFGQLITSEPGRLDLRTSRTPWVAGSWTDHRYP
jgi:hypothetical protein